MSDRIWFGDRFELKDYQNDVIERFKDQDKAALFMDTGTGKTFVSLKLMFEHWTKWDKLIIVAVGNDLSKWAKETGGLNVKGSTVEYFAKHQDEEIYVCTHARIPNMLDNFMVVNDDQRVAIIIDESYKIKSKNAKVTKMLLKWRNRFEYKLLMTATPTSIGYIDLWSQYSFLLPHYTDVLDSYKKFESKYVIKEKNEWLSKQHNFPVYQITGYKNVSELLNLVNPFTVYVEKEKVLSLPETSETWIDVKNPLVNEYKTISNEYYIEVDGSEIFYDTLPRKIGAIRLIKSGISEGKFLSTCKLDACTITGGTVIFVNYIAEADLIYETLTQRGFNVARYYSDHDELEGDVLVMSFSKGAESLDGLQHSFNRVVYFSPPMKWIQYEQSRGRLFRIGQTKKVEFVHLRSQWEVENWECMLARKDYSIAIKQGGE